jgi:hypothetical protein
VPLSRQWLDTNEAAFAGAVPCPAEGWTAVGATAGATTGPVPAGPADGFVDGAAGAVTGVTMTPVTLPVTACFCFDPIVWRAARVDARFATAAACFAVDSGAGFLRGVRP